ncbi:MarR family transcriptional regulator [Nocardioides sp. GY 10127]|uniref:MarR family winged helix-turn-helix transcriptional regulator n=1 Tax=Nocardioides sp. GY 10127 TaxID=2569762 RepID=UPI0010A83AE9|nr:MarR family transcriptional regulator [Nocardioides sp. GY 10127]TIC82793.1 MarR family transcriptional regulator [Nocardioides sp. GY 10127]
MSQAYPQLALDAQLCFPLYATTRAVTRAYASLLEPVGLTYPQYLTMLALWEAGGPVSVSALGARLHLDSGTLTPLLKRLEAAGRVTRQRDPEDERRVLLTVTDAGMALREEVADVPWRLAALMGLDRGEAEVLHGALGRLLRNLDGEGAADAQP